MQKKLETTFNWNGIQPIRVECVWNDPDVPPEITAVYEDGECDLMVDFNYIFIRPQGHKDLIPIADAILLHCEAHEHQAEEE